MKSTLWGPSPLGRHCVCDPAARMRWSTDEGLAASTSPSSLTARSRSSCGLLVKFQSARRQETRDLLSPVHPELNQGPDLVCKHAVRPSTDLHGALLAVEQYTVLFLFSVLVDQRRIKNRGDLESTIGQEDHLPAERAGDSRRGRRLLIRIVSQPLLALRLLLGLLLRLVKIQRRRVDLLRAQLRLLRAEDVRLGLGSARDGGFPDRGGR